MNEASRRPMPHMTADDFLAWPGDGTGRKTQLIDGEVYTMAPASSVHSSIQATLARLIGVAALASGSGLNVMTEAVVQPRVNAKANIRVPDVACTFELLERGQQIIVSPVVLAEVLSPGNEDTTRANILAYTTIPTVQQLVVVHGTRVLVEIHCRADDGQWPADPVFLEKEDTLQVSLAGLVCRVAELYRGTWLA